MAFVYEYPLAVLTLRRNIHTNWLGLKMDLGHGSRRAAHRVPSSLLVCNLSARFTPPQESNWPAENQAGVVRKFGRNLHCVSSLA